MKWVRNREAAKEVLAKDGKALQHASEEMKGDRELCMAAVAQGREQALHWVGQDLKKDEGIVIVALQSYHKSFPQKKGNVSDLEQFFKYHGVPAEMKTARVREIAGI